MTSRVARIGLVYALDNMPGVLTEALKKEADDNFALSSRPVPFNPSSKVSFVIPGYVKVNLKVLDVNGRLIRTLVDTKLIAGKHEYVWDATNSAGNRVAAGLYIYRLTTAKKVLNVRTILSK